MKNKIGVLSFILITIIGMSTFFISCENNDSVIGLGIIPGSDKMELSYDTISVECYTVSDAILSTDERTLATLGSYVDPQFGFSKASFICQTRISSNNVDFSEVGPINSIELHLKYDFHYGDQSTPQTVNIYRLLDDVFIDSVYYSDYKPSESDIELLTSVDLSVPPEDSLFKITLPINLAEQFINPADSLNFIDNDAFIDYFKGFYITTDNLSTGGCIYSFNLYDSESRMMLYYNDSLDYEFYINTKSATLNMFEHDYTSASTEIQTAISDSTRTYSNCYVQSLGGLKTKIFFPDLNTIFDSTNIAVNKAKLIINLEDGYNQNVFIAPPKLALVAILESGKYDFVTDYKVNNSHFGGEYDESDNTYSFNIPFHIQELLNGNTDYGLYLFATDNRTKPYRAILNNSQSGANGIKLEIYYSKY